MDRTQLTDKLREVVKALPDVEKYLTPETLEYIKSKATYTEDIVKLVESLYYRRISDADFLQRFEALIRKHLLKAYQEAWQDNGDGQMPAYLRESYENAVGIQIGHINSYYVDIRHAREELAPLKPLLARAELWGTRYNEEVNKAIALIAATLLTLGTGAAVGGVVAEVAEVLGAVVAGGEVTELGEANMEWIEGDTVDKCTVCLALDGIVAPVSLWRELRVQPQAAPNDDLECGGWRCQCVLQITTKPADEDARERILSAVGR